MKPKLSQQVASMERELQQARRQLHDARAVAYRYWLRHGRDWHDQPLTPEQRDFLSRFQFVIDTNNTLILIDPAP